MNREKIILADYLEGKEDMSTSEALYDYREAPFIFIERSPSQCGYDAEKNMIEYNLILKRKSDNKYFKTTYMQYNYSGDSLHEQEAIEVFPKEKTIIVYE